MDTILQAFLNWQFLFLCIAIGAIVFVIRQVVEYAMENWWPLKGWAAANSNAKIWRELMLPILPIVMGPTITFFATGYAYPDNFTENSSRIIFGLVAGFSSGLIVKLYNSFLSSKISDFANKISNVVVPAPPAQDDYCNDKNLEQSIRDSIKKD